VKNNIPGPGTYVTQDKNNVKYKKAPAFSLGSGSRYDIGGGKESLAKPGPGNYESNAGCTQK